MIPEALGTIIHASKNIISEDRLKKASHQTWSKRETSVACFIYFLIYGRMPKWVIPGQVELQGDWIQHLSTWQIELLAQALVTHRNARERLVYQFDAEFITTVMAYYNPGLSKSVLLSWKGLEKISIAHPNKTIRLRYAYWSYWLGKCVNFSVDEAPLIETIKQWVVYTPEVDVQLSALLGLGKQPKQPRVSFLSEEENALVELLERIFSIAKNKDQSKEFEDIREQQKDNQKKEKENYNKQEIKYVQSVDLSDSSLDIRKDSESKFDANLYNNDLNAQQYMEERMIYAEEDVNHFYTEAAGLILVHPFLVQLFRLQKLWDDNKGWTSSSAQHQAVLLVTWLAFGETNVPEYQLTMPKLLCGMLWEEPIDTTVTLAESCFRSGVELLEAIIQHWKVLGSTSVEGLREGFINREGKLTKKEDGWQLVMEKTAQDILVSKLPWAISIVQLPWLQKKRIFVDWT